MCTCSWTRSRRVFYGAGAASNDCVSISSHMQFRDANMYKPCTCSQSRAVSFGAWMRVYTKSWNIRQEHIHLRQIRSPVELYESLSAGVPPTPRAGKEAPPTCGCGSPCVHIRATPCQTALAAHVTKVGTDPARNNAKCNVAFFIFFEMGGVWEAICTCSQMAGSSMSFGNMYT